ncbi:MAG: hypothetical protein A2817_00665 [Candidatus Yanofskybacteria bacterium RIFCSPHIGHO2_01_FULL_39_8b]|uniref:Polymerase beta nucleotidyltransferase domain-containing protein n=1 Tax=Candidatus Yanofskybacteria bacterium RIFCSPHIGHO2_01_FULL_39_8b TaxID=1802659 RepID=A0A1F8E9E7_9BACT|nr:MAG: hypothetical protein A2817_00665 [Candidatus Yanofskybacteria bacterium RIFCSPHIGHO2_01_FULL_39_8b]
MSEQGIQNIVDTIVTEFKPEKVVLFGSYAWGQPTKDSDIDLFVIKNDAKKNIRDLAIDLERILLPRTFPIDIIVYKPEQVEKYLNEKNMFITKILTKGKILYEH